MNGRKMLQREQLIRQNQLDEKYCLHHIKFKLFRAIPRNFLVKCERDDFVIAIPEDLHELYASKGRYTPKDVNFFYHQFMILQIASQLYDGFNELLEYMITYDNFDSYNRDYIYWKQKEEHD